MSMQKTSAIRFGASIVLGCALALPAAAEIAPDQIARLGADLTPFGGEMAGNAEGTIPEWTGGITEPPAGFELGDHHPDPFAADERLFVIDASNIDEHRDRLSVGHQRMLETYPTFEMAVYPTRRSASAPQRIYDATREVAATARLADGGNGVEGAAVGIPFPIPQNGLEAIWNHLLRYRGETVECLIGQAAVTPRRRLHAGQIRCRDRSALLASRHDPGGARQHDDLLQAAGAGASAACRKRPPRA